MADHDKRRKTRRLLSQGLLAGLVTSPITWTRAIGATAYPNRPIRLVVPFPAGAATDFIARSIGQVLGDQLKTPVVVDNLPGAAGNIAASTVSRADADGYTILLAPSAYVINPYLYANLNFDPKSLVPLGIAVDTELVTVVRKDLPVQDIAGFVALARKSTTPLNFGSPGVGTIAHLGVELLASQVGVNFSHIPYKGSQPALTDLMGGNIDGLIDTAVSSLPLIASGKIKPLAVHSPNRLPVLPKVPTFEEQKYGFMTFNAWNAFMVSRNVPSNIQAILREALAVAVQKSQLVEDFRTKGMTAVVRTPAQYAEFMAAEGQRWGNVVKSKNIKA